MSSNHRRSDRCISEPSSPRRKGDICWRRHEWEVNTKYFFEYDHSDNRDRLGVVDASEIPPTYSAPSEQFVALIAGGDAALRFAQEGAEDDVLAAETDLKSLNLDGQLDCLIGIAASGRTPYVLRCLSFAKLLGCVTVGVACCEPSAMMEEGNADYMISVVTGPEVITGSKCIRASTHGGNHDTTSFTVAVANRVLA